MTRPFFATRFGGRARPWLIAAGVCLWVSGVAAGLQTLWRYENTPGPAAAAPALWPEGSTLPRPDGGPVLVVTLHPQCPCSRATVAELARLLAVARPAPAVHALFVASPGANGSFVQSSLWEAASRIPGVHVRRDDGTEARRFGARVSGQLLAYDRAGHLRFSGGITGSRGHEGANAGRTAVEAMLAGKPHSSSAFVFGCFLFDGEGVAVPESGEA